MDHGAINSSGKDPGRKEGGCDRWAGDTRAVAVLPELEMTLPSKHSESKIFIELLEA